MAEIGVKAFRAEASRVVTEVANGATYVITKRGRPAAVLVPIEDAEDLVLADEAKFKQVRRVGREDHRQGRTTRLGN